MTKDRKKLYIVTALLAAAFLLVLFVQEDLLQRTVLAATSIVFCVAAILLIKKRSAPELEWRQLAWLLPTTGVIVLLAYYLLGLTLGIIKLSLPPSYLYARVIPTIVTVIFAEILRRVLLSQKNKAVTVISFIAFIVSDVAMLSTGDAFGSSKAFIDLFGMTIFPAVTANIFYHYISSKYGPVPVILYKILMTCYQDIIPLKPALPSAMLAFLKIALPIVILFAIRFLYERRRFAVSKQNVYVRVATTCILILIMLLSVMLISCRFRFGLLVIATESMSGTIDKGDAIVYEKYDNRPLVEGQVIVFEKNGRTTVHRVVEIKNVNGENRYYTMGDANPTRDTGYITSQDIVGTTDLTIKYIGHPSLWIRQIFK